MTPPRVPPQAARWLYGLATGALIGAAVTGVVALLDPHVPVLSLLVLYLLAVLPVAVRWGAGPAMAVSVLCTAVFAYLFLPPHRAWDLAEPRNAVALGVFLVTAVVVGDLAARLRAAARESARLTEEQAGLRRVATLVAQATPSATVFEAVTREVGMLCGADLARMERYDDDGLVTGVAAWSRLPVRLAVNTRFDLDGLSIARQVRLTSGPVTVDSFADASGPIAAEARQLGIRSSVGCPIVVNGHLWGVIAASANRENAFPAGTEAQITAFTELVATAIADAEARANLRRMVDEQAALRRLATQAARGVEPDRLFVAVAEEVGTLVGADLTAVLRFEADGIATFMGGCGWSEADMRQVGSGLRPWLASITALVAKTGQPARADPGAGDAARLPTLVGEEVRCAVANPIVVGTRLWGMIAVASRSSPLPSDTEQRMANFTEIVAIAIANAESRTELAASRARVIAAADATRRRLERDLHDGAQQRLVSLALELRHVEGTVPADLPEVRADIRRAADELTDALDELRELSRGIHPAILSEGGLGPALRTLARRAGVPVELDMRTPARFPEPVEVAAYYVVSEAVTNTTKHARASHAEVVVEERDGRLWLRVCDDGGGGADPQRGSGLTGLRDRVEALGGALHVDSPPGDGTLIEASLPL
jgi:signal transduction histidine kinase